jgi:hypothetical protein
LLLVLCFLLWSWCSFCSLFSAGRSACDD